MTNHHGLFRLGYIRATTVITMRSNGVIRSKSLKISDHLIEEYTKIYQNVAQLNHCNGSDIAMDTHSQSMDSTNCASNFATSTRLDEHSNTRVAMCLQCGGDEGVQHNVNFAFEFGDEDQLSDLLLK
jgi:hypothetical protein